MSWTRTTIASGTLNNGGSSMWRYFRWWQHQLARSIPRWLESRCIPQPYVVVLCCSDSGVALGATWDFTGAGLTRVPELGTHRAWDDVREQALQASGLKRSLRRIELWVPISRCLERSKTLPAAARSRLDEVMALDLVANSPFRLDQVYSGAYITDRGNLQEFTARQIVLKRSLVREIVDDLASQGAPIAAIRVLGPDGRALPVNLLSRVRAESDRMLVRAIGALAAVVMALAVALSATAWFSLSHEMEKIDRQFEILRRQAQSAKLAADDVQAAVIRLDSVALRQRSEPLAIDIWAEVTRLLPDSAWLETLSIEHDAVSMTGRAEAAAELIAKFSTSRLLRDAAFAAPVVRDPLLNAERFSIKLRIARRAS